MVRMLSLLMKNLERLSAASSKTLTANAHPARAMAETTPGQTCQAHAACHPWVIQCCCGTHGDVSDVHGANFAVAQDSPIPGLKHSTVPEKLYRTPAAWERPAMYTTRMIVTLQFGVEGTARLSYCLQQDTCLVGYVLPWQALLEA